MQAFVQVLYTQYSLATARRLLALVTASVLFFMSTFGFAELALAQASESVETELKPVPSETPSEFPYKTNFVISAYYSPLLDQEYFLTGDYSSEIRLNGGGVRGADGTSVYPGMIAAPKKYPFGTKMLVPGVGTVAVHDRGGAIVEAGSLGHAFDRLDIWMGHGEVGLRRALAWGKKTVMVTVYGVDSSIAEAVNLEGLPQAKYLIAKRAAPQLFRHSLQLNDHGDQVVKLQRFLQHLNYFDGEITGFYGQTTADAVMKFQMDQDLIKNLDDFAAGQFGVGTRVRLEAIIGREKDKYKKELPIRGLGKGDTGPDVKKLQTVLHELGYLPSVTGVYDDVTVDAVFRFQVDQNVVQEEADRGAGYFGPKTEATLQQKYLAKKGREIEKEEAPIDIPDVRYFDRDLATGDNGPDVTRLQEQLRVLNYLRAEPTGYYGALTAHAVFKVQQRLRIVSTIGDHGAGVFGPQTRARINELLLTTEQTKKLIAIRTLEYNAAKFVAKEESAELVASSVASNSDLAVSQVFPEDLAPGSRGKIVRTLQLSLKDLGFFKGHLTSEYFGTATQKAVAAFQFANKLIDSEHAEGAGALDSKTRDVLNRALQG